MHKLNNTNVCMFNSSALLLSALGLPYSKCDGCLTGNRDGITLQLCNYSFFRLHLSSEYMAIAITGRTIKYYQRENVLVGLHLKGLQISCHLFW